VNVRELRAKDIEPLITELWLPFAEEMAEMDPYNELAGSVREEARSYRRGLLEDEDTVTYLAEHDASLVGYTVGAYGESPPVFTRGPATKVEELYVRPERREEGIGSELLDRLEGWARARGCERLSLSVNARNDAAIETYSARGFSVRRHTMDREL
jgi:GNAT superfamily N-acetyltransferase